MMLELAPTLACGLIVVVLYRKLRRVFVRNRVRPVGLVIKVALCSAVAVLVGGSLALTSPGWLGAGALGGALGWIALCRTTFENEAGGSYYTPDRTIGLAVSGLFLGRVLYRLIAIVPLLESGTYSPADFGQGTSGVGSSPLTRAVLLLLVSYYACFLIGVLVRSRTARDDPTSA